MVKCTTKEMVLSMFYDGEINGTEGAKLKEHIKICPNCKNKMKEYTHDTSILDSRLKSLKAKNDLAHLILK